MTDETPPRDLVILAAEVDALRAEAMCSSCKGSGKCALFGEDLSCPSCNGTGKVRPSWPRVITGMQLPDMSKMLDAPTFSHHAPGSFVAVRPVKDNKTYLGIYLGSFAASLLGGITPDGTLTLSFGFGNPAIWVPDLNRIVRGYESWWGEIESPEQLREITDGDIDGVWYVQALRQLDAGAATPDGDADAPVTG